MRIFGETPGGQKGCLHLHGAFPYFYVPYDDDLPREPSEASAWLKSLARGLDEALGAGSNAAADARDANPHAHAPGVTHPGSLSEPVSSTHSRISRPRGSAPRRRFVHDVSLVRAKPFYGFAARERLFAKVRLYDPACVTRARAVMLGGGLMSGRTATRGARLLRHAGDDRLQPPRHGPRGSRDAPRPLCRGGRDCTEAGSRRGAVAVGASSGSAGGRRRRWATVRARGARVRRSAPAPASAPGVVGRRGAAEVGEVVGGRALAGESPVAGESPWGYVPGVFRRADAEGRNQAGDAERDDTGTVVAFFSEELPFDGVDDANGSARLGRVRRGGGPARADVQRRARTGRVRGRSPEPRRRVPRTPRDRARRPEARAVARARLGGGGAARGGGRGPASRNPRPRRGPEPPETARSSARDCGKTLEDAWRRRPSAKRGAPGRRA